MFNRRGESPAIKYNKMKYLQNIFKEAGYYVDFDNRSKTVKQINQLLKDDVIKVELIKKGFHRTDKKGNKYKAKITIGDYQNKIIGQDDRNVTPYNLLRVIGRLLKDEKVRESIKKHFYITEECTCNKCNGTGIIPQFIWYAEGVCFDCMGSGIKGVYNVIEKK